jgi:hypothetical protein
MPNGRCASSSFHDCQACRDSPVSGASVGGAGSIQRGGRWQGRGHRLSTRGSSSTDYLGAVCPAQVVQQAVSRPAKAAVLSRASKSFRRSIFSQLALRHGMAVRILVSETSRSSAEREDLLRLRLRTHLVEIRQDGAARQGNIGSALDMFGGIANRLWQLQPRPNSVQYSASSVPQAPVGLQMPLQKGCMPTTV